MRSRASSALAVIVAALACLGFAPMAQAEPAPSVRLSVAHRTIAGGQLAVTASATTACTWLLEWNGERRVMSGRTFADSFTAPLVDRPTRIPLDATCFYTSTDQSDRRGRSEGSGRGGSLIVRIPPSWHQTVVVTVVPPHSAVQPPHSSGGVGHGFGHLVDTGGPPLLLLLTGLGAVVVGTAMTRRHPRRLGV